MPNTTPTRNLAFDLVRVTEAAALAAGRMMGRGDKNGADKAAVDAMRVMLNSISMRGTIIIGEGEKDEAPMLYNGEKLGTGEGPEVDIAVDPIEGTRPLAYGLWNSISTVALAPRGTMFNPGPFVYMNKIAVGPVARHAVDIDAPVSDNLHKVAKAKGVKVEDLTVVVLDRPRHQELITQIRMAGARIKLIPDGDVAGALMTSMGDNTADLLMGVGGTPEGVLAAAGLRCMGGEIIGKLYPRNQRELDLAKEMGVDFEKPLTMDDLISSDNVFFAATGITTGDYLRGVTYFKDGARTDSVVMRGLSGTVRRVISTHKLSKLMRISSIKYK
ncbi:MAG TPA: class II fructose-bisphosphatase [Anaerolineaceae bacterium]|jgi:fructose-1,6-bisphosphatase II|nr:class II fructose-bisphosphatase [Anaerolineaceae bacterium]HOS53200.1 class II fructose-bisphosphatase [Anaerolineaceae bacterium]HQF68711.1 class II fructose-bisphosphatase [Anaerolineaceae bacterium]HRT91376.1 class II fructose-bisphosphatase [Anaerolineaceae bacterium]